MGSASASSTSKPAPAAEAAGAAPVALRDTDLKSLFAPFARAPVIALAVSGGADSLALLDAADRWARKRRRPPKLVVLTVDHRLRRGSARDAAAVASFARSRNLEVRVLTRKGRRPTADVEGAARAARYRLLIDACRAIGARFLLVAHHRDDVAETYLMRVERGSGVFGLAAMRASIDVADPVTGKAVVTIARPFLRVPRARLAATTAAAGWTPVDDPMNRDPRYARTGVRNRLRDGRVDPETTAAAAFASAEAADAIDAAATAFIKASVMADRFAVAWLDRASFAAAPEDVRLRVLVRILLAVGGEDYPPRFERLSALQTAILGVARLKRTLSGVVAESGGDRVAFYRELGRSGLRAMPVRAGSSGVWDRRFAVVASPDVPDGLVIGPLGHTGRAVPGVTGVGLPAGAIAALPALRRRGKTVAAPVFGAKAAAVGVRVRSVLAGRLARPPLFPDFAGT